MSVTWHGQKNRKHEQLDRLLVNSGSPSLTVLGNHVVITMKISLGGAGLLDETITWS